MGVKVLQSAIELQLELMGISETLNIYFSYSRDDVLRYIMELSSEGDEIYKNMLFFEDEPSCHHCDNHRSLFYDSHNSHFAQGMSVCNEKNSVTDN